MSTGEVPTTPPGISTPGSEGLGGEAQDEQGTSPVPSYEVGSPVTYAPPGWDSFQDPPVLPRGDPSAFPIGGGQNLVKVFSHKYI